MSSGVEALEHTDPLCSQVCINFSRVFSHQSNRAIYLSLNKLIWLIQIKQVCVNTWLGIAFKATLDKVTVTGNRKTGFCQ